MRRSLHPDALLQIIRNRLLQHIAFWAALFCMAVLPESSGRTLGVRASHAAVYLSPIAAVVYLHFFLWDQYLARKRYWPYAGGLALTICAFAYMESFLFGTLFGSKESAITSAVSLGFFILFTSAIRLAKAGVKQKMEFQEIKAKQLQTELDFLRAQINPHFLFNTLNNLYSMAQREEDTSVADAIARLSHLMRYVIYDSNVARIELSREIDQIRGYIELQKLRFTEDDDIRISLDVSGGIGTRAIAPMILLPFVENAFKHGISLQQPSRIRITAAVVDGELLFSAENTVRQSESANLDENSAVGLKNVRRRLQLLYPDAHQLMTERTAVLFKITLRLRLQ